MVRKASALIVLAAGVAQGQINITAQTRFVEATAGNGSGTSHIDCLNFLNFNQNASKSWNTGNNHIHQVSSMTPWTLNCDMTSSNNANSDGEAGSVYSKYRVDFSISEPMDVYAQGGPSGDNSSGTNNRMWNRNTNGTVFGGGGNFYQHLAAGPYAYEQTINTFSRGTADDTMDIQFRPGNDQCQYARVVTNGWTTGSTVAASGTGDGPASCDTPAFPNAVWFSYTAPRTGPVLITTCGSNFDTVLTVFNNTNCNLAAGNIVTCNDDAPADVPCAGGTRHSAVTLNVHTGESFLIRLSGYNDIVGDYRLNVGPINDRCDSMIPAVLGDNPFNNTMADTDGAVLTSCTGFGDNQINGDLWYYYQPPADGLLSLNTCGSAFDTKLALYNGYSCGAAGLMACNDDSNVCAGSTVNSNIGNVGVVAGHWYTIRVGGFQTERGAGNLHLAFAPYCPADFNQDGIVDFFDYLDFVSAFSSSAPAADFNNDSVIDFFDYLDFVSAFSSGC